MTEAIRTEALTKRFGTVTALSALTLSVAEGELFGLVGPDGAGKSTTMRLLASIMDPTSGDAWVAGHHTVKDGEAVKEKIGYVSQRFGLYGDLTVSENIDFYADVYGVPRGERKQMADRVLAFSNLAPFKNRTAANLSGGMKQKLGLACALVHTPKVLLLDEPTSGVDPISRRELWQILYQLVREKVTIFVSTSYLDEAERLNRIAFVHKGRLLACGAPEEIKRLMRGSIIEMRPSEPRNALSLLRADLESCVINLFGDRLHIVSVDPQAATKRAQAVLLRSGVQPGPVRSIQPGLEDVFASVLAEQDRGDG